jgi:hypothetical protein
LPPLRLGATPSLRVSVPCGAISMGSLLRVPCRTLPTEFCLLRSVPPSGFLNLLTACSSQCLVALFHATGTRWVLPSELCSLPGAVPPLDGRCPRVVLRPTPRNIVTQWRSRLQGVALLESPAPAARWLGSRLPLALLGLCPSRVTHSARQKRCFHLLPLLSFTDRRRNCGGCDFRGLPVELHGWSPKRLPTLMGFSHLVKLAEG